MLLGNYNVIHKSPGKFLGGPGAISSVEWRKNGSMRAIHTSSLSPKLWGLPTGYGKDGWMLPRTAGYIVGFSEIQLAQTGSAVMGRNGDGYLTAVLSGTADLSLISSGIGLCTITLTVGGDMAAALYGSGNAMTTFTGTGALGAIAFSIGESVITFNAEANMTALGYMTGEMTPFTELSPQSLAKAIWSSLANENNDPNTMGSKLNAAGSGGIDLNALAQALWEYDNKPLILNLNPKLSKIL